VSVDARDLVFPPGFSWGAATSSHQVDGGRAGRLEDSWDRFSTRPGAIRGADTAVVACDHLRLMDDDVRMMRDLGLGAYRFSVSWARAEGPDGLEPYRRLVDLLARHGIDAMATLYHWDHPQVVEDAGGWRTRATAERFAAYAAGVVAALGDGVRWWCTLNEPWCVAFLGHASGEHAPGRRDAAEAVAAAHHQLLGHGLAVQALRAAGAGNLGLALNPAPVHGDGSITPDEVRRIDGTLNRLFLDPVLTGRYPADVLDDLARAGIDTSCIPDGDQRIVAQPIDWLGVNYYHDHTYGRATAPGANGSPSPHVTAPGVAPVDHARQGAEVTDLGWPLTPDGLEQLLVRLRDDYGETLPPILITENGAAYDDPVVDGRCDDVRRVRYLDAHVAAVHRAIERGVDVRGYLAWSLMDNFEWAHGLRQRFGLVHVDFDTLVRTPRASAAWFRERARR